MFKILTLLSSLIFHSSVYGSHYKADIENLYVSNSGNMIATSYANTITLWSPENKQAIGVLKGHSQRPDFISFNNSESQLVSIASAGLYDSPEVFIWDLSSRKIIKNIHDLYNPRSIYGIHNIYFTADDKHLIVHKDSDGIVKLRIEDNQIISTYQNDSNYLFVFKNSILAISGFDGTISLWNTNSNKRIATIKDFKDIQLMKLDHNSSQLAIAYVDTSINVFDVSKKEFSATINSYGKIRSQVYRILCGSYYEKCFLRSWFGITITHHNDIGFNSYANSVFSANESGYLYVWSIKKQDLLSAVKLPSSHTRFSYSGNGNIFVSYNENGFTIFQSAP